MPRIVSWGTLLPKGAKAKSITVAQVSASPVTVGLSPVRNPSAIPAVETCAKTALKKTMRRNTTKTPRKAQSTAISELATSAYCINGNWKTLIMALSRNDKRSAVGRSYFDRHIVQPGQVFFRQNFFDRADLEKA